MTRVVLWVGPVLVSTVVPFWVDIHTGAALEATGGRSKAIWGRLEATWGRLTHNFAAYHHGGHAGQVAGVHQGQIG